MGLISKAMGKNEKPINITNNVGLIYFGIINIASQTKILIGPSLDENEIYSTLLQEVKKMMDDPVSEMIVGEDSAAVYQQIDNEAIIVSRIDFGSLLDEDE